jgi:hypothetical protein
MITIASDVPILKPTEDFEHLQEGDYYHCEHPGFGDELIFYEAEWNALNVYRRDHDVFGSIRNKDCPHGTSGRGIVAQTKHLILLDS